MGFAEMVVVIVFLALLFGSLNHLIKYRASRRKASGHQGESTAQALVEIERLKRAERAEARKLYERLVQEKLDVIKTAVAMGHDESNLRILDERLEQLIGRDKLENLLAEEPRVPEVSADLMDDDLQAEVDRLARGKAAH
jgi:hypothetical protein